MTEEKVSIYYAINSQGDGSYNIVWFVTQVQAQTYNDNQDEPGGGGGPVQTYWGSNIHSEALDNADSYFMTDGITFIPEDDQDGQYLNYEEDDYEEDDYTDDDDEEEEDEE